MAKEALQKLEEELNCSICLDTYTDPKLLQCFHVYCLRCLVPLVVRDQQGRLGLTCPTCRQVTPIPDRGVAGLQSAFHINHLLEIRESLQKQDLETLTDITPEDPAATPEEAAPTDLNPVKLSHCSVHEGKKLELYCETCGELICTRCALKGGKHQGHDYKELDQAFEKYINDIILSLEPLEKQVATVKKALEQIDVRSSEISDQQTAIESSIHLTFRQLQEVLSVRETKLISRLHQLTQGKLKGLAAQRDQIETTLAQLSSCLHFIRESLRSGNEGDTMTMKTNTVKKVKALTTPFQPDILKPYTEADIVFTALADLTAACQNYGQFITCHVTGKGADVAVVGERSKAILQTITFEGSPCEELIRLLECKLVSEVASTRVSCGVERRGQSQYKINYQPAIKGRHQLHIKVGDQHVRGSPFSIAVKSAVKKLGLPILTIDGSVKPRGVAITQRGEVVVTDEGWGQHRVSVFSPSGEKLRSFGTHGSGQGQFLNPRGVAVDGEGNFLVVDGGNHSIQKFTAGGQFLTTVGTEGSGMLQFSSPSGIAFNAGNNKVYVADGGNCRVKVLHSDLAFSSSFGDKGSGKGQFNSPWGVACDSTGKVYVADTLNHRMQVFTAEKRFLRMFGGYGRGKGELKEPVGVAVDTSGMVYVSERGNDRVSVFTSEGQFVTSFGRRGTGPGEFLGPGGLAVDNSGIVYVCNNTRLQLF